MPLKNITVAALVAGTYGVILKHWAQAKETSPAAIMGPAESIARFRS